MKKTILLAIIVLLATTLLTATSAFARPGKGNLKGIITAIDYDNKNLTITTNKGESMSVIAAEGFDLEPFEVGQWVLVKGTIQEDGTIAAVWIKRVGKGSDLDNYEDKPEVSKANSAYCSEGKHVKSHPLALKIAERFSVKKDWVMGYFCDGYGMGAIMLALKTAEITGGNPADLLADRAEGRGWGQIWQESKLIGNEREAHSPPGRLKRPAHAGGNK